MDNIYVVSPTVALVTSVLLQVVKNSTYFPWLNRNTGKLNAAVGMIVALLTSVGIIASFDFNQQTGAFAAGFSGNVWDVLHALGHAVVQWAEQHAIYKSLLVPSETLGEIRTLLTNNQTPAKP